MDTGTTTRTSKKVAHDLVTGLALAGWTLVAIAFIGFALLWLNVWKI